MEKDDHFNQSKANLLQALQKGLDWSPKGSIDKPVLELVELINNLPDYATTSSCSGRISCYRDGHNTKGIEWLLVEHRCVSTNELLSSICKHDSSISFNALEDKDCDTKPSIMLKCEPFILHVQCRDIYAAQKLHQLGMSCGYRESGIGIGQKKIMVAIRTMAFCLELPIVVGSKYIMDENSLNVIVAECNRKLTSNFVRIDRLMSCIKKSFGWPSFHCTKMIQSNPNDGYLSYWNQSFFGHSSVLLSTCTDVITNTNERVIFNVGGEGTTGRNISPHLLSASGTSFTLLKVFDKSPVLLPSFNCVHPVVLACPILINGHSVRLVHDDEINSACASSLVHLVVVTGGRKSPIYALPAISNAFLIHTKSTTNQNNNSADINDWCMESVDFSQEGAIPSARWGHSVVRIGPAQWVLSGGRDKETVFNDMFVLDAIIQPSVIESTIDQPLGRIVFRWTAIKCSMPTPRFFHSTCFLRSGKILIASGGLGEDELNGNVSNRNTDHSGDFYAATLPSSLIESSDTFSRFDTEDVANKLQWNLLRFKGEASSLRRFGHTLTSIGGNCVAVIGGSSFNSKDFLRREINSVEVWDITLSESFWSVGQKLKGLESPDHQATVRFIPVKGDVDCDDMDLHVGSIRAHHQAVWNNAMSQQRGGVILLMGGGVACSALFHPTFASFLKLDICCQGELSVKYDYVLENKTLSQYSIKPKTCESQDYFLSIIIPKKNTKAIKMFLEEGNWLDKGARISPVSASTSPVVKCVTTIGTSEASSDIMTLESLSAAFPDESTGDKMAVPVTETFYVALCGERSDKRDSTAATSGSVSLSTEECNKLRSLLYTHGGVSKVSSDQRDQEGDPVGSCDDNDTCVENMSVIFSRQLCNINKTVIATGQSSMLLKKQLGSKRSSDDTAMIGMSSTSRNGIENIVDASQCPSIDNKVVKDNESHDATAMVNVVIVPKKNTKAIKMFLEEGNWLDKGARISPVSASTSPVVKCVTTIGTSEASSDITMLESLSAAFPDESTGDKMAVPVTETFYVALCGERSDKHDSTAATSGSVSLSTEECNKLRSLLCAVSSDSDSSLGKNTSLELFFAKQKCSLNKAKHSSCSNKANMYIRSYLSANCSKPDQVVYPSKFELVGDVVMIPEGCLEDIDLTDEEAARFWKGLLECFNNNFSKRKMRKVARKARIDPGLKRESMVRLLYPTEKMPVCENAGPDGPGWTEVVEGGISYGFDITRVMFCSGNVTERMRVGSSSIQAKGETVVDLYAGIGYYTIPFLVRGGASCVHACEWNPHSITALKVNLLKAGVPAYSHRTECDPSFETPTDAPCCVIYEGDNAISAAPGGPLDSIADRVCLGLIPSSKPGWPLGVNVLKTSGGMLHVHENVMDSSMDAWVEETCEYFESLFCAKVSSRDHDRHMKMVVRCVHLEVVKSYAPHLYHVVADLKCSLERNRLADSSGA